jgi:hypothetical protein
MWFAGKPVFVITGQRSERSATIDKMGIHLSG